MTTFLENWEARSDNADICSWLEQALQEKAVKPWRISVIRHDLTSREGVLTVVANQPEFRLSARAYFDVREECTLEEAVSAVAARLKDSVEEFQKKITFPFAEKTSDAEARD